MRKIASELRAHREAIGMSLEELFERTRINPEYLRAIETGNYDVLPEIYIRLFLKKYAQEVGLDVEETLDKYDKTRPHSKSPQIVVRRERDRSLSQGPILAILCVLALGVVIAAITLRRDSTSSAPVETEAPMSGNRSRSTTSGGETSTPPEPETPPAAPVETAAPMSGNRSQSTTSGGETSTPPEPEIPPAAPEGQAAAATSESLHTALPEPDNTGNLPPRERVVSSYSLPQKYSGIWEDELVLSVRVLVDTRVRIFSDGDSTFENRLLSGTQRQWTARERFRVEIEDPSAVTLSLQDRPVSLPTKHGRKHRLFISRSNIWVEEIESVAPAPAR
jgi:cytoskeletal protein RodZ